MAAGLTIQMSRLGELRAFFETVLREPVLAHDGHHLDIDAALSARGASVELIESIEKAGPFGAGHPEPVFVFPNHRVAYADLVGNGHLRVTLASADGAMIKAMLFRAVNTPRSRTRAASCCTSPGRCRSTPGRSAASRRCGYWTRPSPRCLNPPPSSPLGPGNERMRPG